MKSTNVIGPNQYRVFGRGGLSVYVMYGAGLPVGLAVMLGLPQVESSPYPTFGLEIEYTGPDPVCWKPSTKSMYSFQNRSFKSTTGYARMRVFRAASLAAFDTSGMAE